MSEYDEIRVMVNGKVAEALYRIVDRLGLRQVRVDAK